LPTLKNRIVFILRRLTTATGGGFFFVSEDGGDTWRASMKNYPQRLIVYSILQDQEELNTIYLGTNFWHLSFARPRRFLGSRNRAEKACRAPNPARKEKLWLKSLWRNCGNNRASPKPLPKIVDALTERVNQLSPTHDGKNGMYGGDRHGGCIVPTDVSKGWERLLIRRFG
jgi:hypothetical protein